MDRSLMLKRALESVKNQTYKNYIHVILNNGGDQKELEKLLDEYPDKNRIVINNRVNAGMTKGENQAIRAVKSEYITILDDDDAWPPERLEKTVTYLDETKEKAVAVKMIIVIEEINGDTIKRISETIPPESTEGEINLYKQFTRNYLADGIVTYRRDVYEELGGYDESMPTAADWDFGIRLLLRYDVALLRNEEPMLYYHQRPTQTGVQGNAVHAGLLRQEKTINMLRNKYLRDDLKAGKIGVGYIMNQTAYDAIIDQNLRLYIEAIAKQIIEKVDDRTDHITGNISNQLDQQDYVRRAKAKIKRIVKRDK